MVKEAARQAIFKGRQTETVFILCAVRWYLRYSLSLRDLEELLVERGLEANHTTIWRWVQRYGPREPSGLVQSLARVRTAAARSAGYGSVPAQHFGDLSVVLCQELDLLLQILGQRPGPPELQLQVLDRSFEPLHLGSSQGLL